MSTVIEPAESVRSVDADSICENRTENEDDRVALTEGPATEDANGDLQVPSDSSVWAKMDLIVLPVTTMMFFLSSLDRSNIGNARVAGFQEQLGISDEQFSFALTITIIPYTIVNFPTNALQKLIGPRILLPSMVVLWGAVCAFQGLLRNYSGLLVCRFFLGLFEGGLLPGIVLYLSSFYPKRKLQLRIALLFSATSLASAFSGLLAAAIVKMDGVGGKPGWAWLFILEGAFTVLYGFAAFFMLPNTPTSARFFTEAEKSIIRRTLHDDGIMLVDEHDKDYTWTEFGRAFLQPHVILIALSGFFNGATVSGLAYFLPSIVKGLGYAGTRAQLMSVPPFAVTAVFSVVTSFLADRYARRGLSIISFSTIAAIGLSIFLGSYINPIRYLSLFLLVPGSYCIAPALGAWMANNTAPALRRATALALLSTMSNVGSLVSAWVLGALSTPPRYTVGAAVLLAFQLGIFACAVGNVRWLVAENRRREKSRGEEAEVAEAPGRVLRNDSVWFSYVL
ncbi:MFS general substrate transporter [Trametes versicolor FP-101664 SS1]|uniref:MFS general substrate transporter n=1 Tax=Trametes versicolor (strain FP-101664) TaxID=717944 RepID=UPI0004622B38|nr:MFS general substrate transporter [Trametes versicolor FP-101664 SS1]EIW60615.1 MFS general substrate transporter [Trametes versicolor FP-101664 SS1]